MVILVALTAGCWPVRAELTCSVRAVRYFTHQHALELVGEPSVKTIATLVKSVTTAYPEHLSVCLLALFSCFASCRAIHHRILCVPAADSTRVNIAL